MAGLPDGTLDADRLIEDPPPAPRNLLGWGLLAFFAVVLGSAWISTGSPTGERLIRVLSPLLMLAMLAALTYATVRMTRTQKAEMQQVESADELIRLRRWPEAAALLERLLSGGVRHPGVRVQGLIHAAQVLARFERFDEANRLIDHLLERSDLDPPTRWGLQLASTMAMLRLDHLTDAVGSIARLRRSAPEGGSGGLALLEMYRDVKTGNPHDLVERFGSDLPLIRAQLGYRVADAHALAAWGHDRLGNIDAATRAWADATTLAPPDELVRRYPELSAIGAKYPPAVMPAEVAA